MSERVAHLVLVFIAALVVPTPVAWTAESRPELAPNGLELESVEAVSSADAAGLRHIDFRFRLRNVGASTVTVLTRNLQTELWDYKVPPKEVHITLSALAVRHGETVHPPLEHLGPVRLRPGESVEVAQRYRDRRHLTELVLVYDMLNSTAEKYGTWRGRIRSPVVTIRGS